MTTYTVIEKQVNDQGQQAILTQSYTDENLALSDMYTRLASASVSVIPYHAVHLIKYINNNVYIGDGRAFDRTPEPEPEEEPVEE